MTKRQIIILGAILAILALGILLKGLMRSVGEGMDPAVRTGVAFLDFEPAKAERILIGRGTGAASVELAKENGVWRVKSLWGAPANSAKAEKFIRELISARGELRATGSDLFKDFGIEESDAFSIKCLGPGNAVLLDLWVGTKKEGAGGSFIRRIGSADIYLVDRDITEMLGVYADLGTSKPDGIAWTDLSLFRVDPEQVTQIMVYRKKGNEKNMVLGLVRKPDPKIPGQGVWSYLRQEMRLPLDPEKVVRFIAMMNSVRAEGVVDPEGKEYGLAKPAWELDVYQGSKKTVLTAGPKADKKDLYYAKVSSVPTLFSLKPTYFDDLNVDDTSFVKEIPKDAEPKKSP